MKAASSDIDGALKVAQKKGPLTTASAHLLIVVSAFIRLQEERHQADYDTGKEWRRVDVRKLISIASGAFKSWNAIRDEPEAQAYLVALLGKRRRHE